MRVLVYCLNADLEAVRASLRGRFTDEDRVSYREKSAWKRNELEQADLILVHGNDQHAERVQDGCRGAGLRVERVEGFLQDRPAANVPIVESNTATPIEFVPQDPVLEMPEALAPRRGRRART